MKFQEAFAPRSIAPQPAPVDTPTWKDAGLHPRVGALHQGSKLPPNPKERSSMEQLKAAMYKMQQASPETYKNLQRDVLEIEEKINGLIIPTSSPDKQENAQLRQILQSYLALHDVIAEIVKEVNELAGEEFKGNVDFD